MEIHISTSILGRVSAPFDGHYAMVFDDKYFRGADQSSLVGDWSYSGANGGRDLSITADGSLTGTTQKLLLVPLVVIFQRLIPVKMNTPSQ